MSDLILDRAPLKKKSERIYSIHPVGHPIRHLNQVELSRRWSMSPRTLERWRYLKVGPPFLKLGGKILYQLEDVEAYEAETKQTPKNNCPVGSDGPRPFNKPTER